MVEDSPKEAELSLKIRLDGEGKAEAEEEKEEEKAKPVTIASLRQSQEIARQENKVVAVGRRIELLKVRKDGFLQSLIIAWFGAVAVPTVNIHLDLGKNGAFHVDSDEYFAAGMILAHSAQDFWISKRDDTNKLYAMVITPSIPIQFNGLRIILTNNNTAALTVSLAQLKYYREIEDRK